MPQVRAILGGLPLSHFAEVHDAPIEVDRKHATDLTLKITGGDIAARLRFFCNQRDLTIRAHRDNGMKTELAKIQEGFAYRYFYGWVDASRIISEWILVDLDKVRMAGLLGRERRLIPNGDGTHFIAIATKELHDAGCLITYQLNDQLTRQLKSARQVNLHPSLEAGVQRARDANYYRPKMQNGGDR